MIRGMHEKSTANTLHNSEKPTAFPWDQKVDKKNLAFITAIQTAGEVLARAMRQEKEIKGNNVAKKETKYLYLPMTSLYT